MPKLLDELKAFDPIPLSSGQIRIKCPFRENHTDGSGLSSMFLSPEINGYHCFSCKSKGRLVSLLTTKFDISYFDAVEMVHIDTDSYRKKKVDFEVGDSWAIKPPKVFLQKGYLPSTLNHFQVGLIQTGERKGTICIPTYSAGELKGVIYQVRKEGKPKRVWHSDNFPKREMLYNFNTGYEYTVLVEGPTDVWRIFQHKYNVCGAFGSDLSEEQAELLKAFKVVYLMGDNDDAGIHFNEIAYHRLKNHVEVLFIPYMSDDPGETTMREFIRGYRNASDYITYSMAMMEHPRYEKIRQDVQRALNKE